MEYSRYFLTLHLRKITLLLPTTTVPMATIQRVLDHVLRSTSTADRRGEVAVVTLREEGRGLPNEAVRLEWTANFDTSAGAPITSISFLRVPVQVQRHLLADYSAGSHSGPVSQR